MKIKYQIFQLKTKYSTFIISSPILPYIPIQIKRNKSNKICEKTMILKLSKRY